MWCIQQIYLYSIYDLSNYFFIWAKLQLQHSIQDLQTMIITKECKSKALNSQVCRKVNKNLMLWLKQPAFWIIGYISDILVVMLRSNCYCLLDLCVKNGTLSGSCHFLMQRASINMCCKCILGQQKLFFSYMETWGEFMQWNSKNASVKTIIFLNIVVFIKITNCCQSCFNVRLNF